LHRVLPFVASNAVSQHRRFAHALLTPASPSAQVAQSRSCSKVPGGRKSAPNGRPKDPRSHTFVNTPVMNFSLDPVDIIEIARVSTGSSSRRSTPVGSVWDYHDDCCSIDTWLSSLSDDIFEAVPQAKEDCRSI
jgi:hypothetical protein